MNLLRRTVKETIIIPNTAAFSHSDVSKDFVDADVAVSRSTVDMVVQGGEEKMHETLRAGLILIFLDVDNLRNRESINT